MKTSLRFLLLGFAFALVHVGALAADLIVTTPANVGPGSLREILSTAGPGDTVKFDPGVFASSRLTIELGSEIVPPAVDGVTIDASELPFGVAISGNQTSRLFSIPPGAVITFRGLTLTLGNGSGGASSGLGGAILNAGELTLDRCALVDNAAGNGGGAVANQGSLTLTQSTLTGNETAGSGGAIADAGDALTIVHCTIASNSALNTGGGVAVNGCIATITNSILSGNSASVGRDLYTGGPEGGVLRAGANVIVDFAKTPNAPDSGTTAITADPLIGTITENGGPTPTIALLAYSKAIDGVPAGAGVPELTVDQRGFPRTLGAATDLGAYESGNTDFTLDGLTLYTRVPPDQIGTGVFFEISVNADFSVPNPTVSTLSGDGSPGLVNGLRRDARYDLPSGVAQDSSGNIFIADAANHVIRMLSPDGVVSTIAGTGSYGIASGPGLSAAFAFPSAIAVGPDDNVYVSDTYNHRICKLTRPPTEGAEWTVSTLAGTGIAGFLNGAGSVAKFHFPYGLDLDAFGNVYVADSSNHRIRKIAPDGVTTTFAGTGVQGFLSGNPATAQFLVPQGLVIVSKAGFPDIVCVADRGNNAIRQIATDTEVSGLVATMVSTLAGGVVPGFVDAAIGTDARFASPSSLAADSDRNVYVGDEQNHAIRKVTIDGEVTTIAGDGGAGYVDGNSIAAKFNAPTGLIVARDGTLVVADSGNETLRTVAIGPLRVPAVEVAGDVDDVGQLLGAQLNLDLLGLSPDVRYYFRYRLPDDTTQLDGQSFTFVELPVVTTLPADNLTPTSGRMNGSVNPKSLPTNIALEYSFNPDLSAPLAVSNLAGATAAGFVDSPTASLARFSDPRGLVVSGGNIYVADYQNHRIRKVSTTGATTTLAGSTAGFLNGLGSAAKFDRPAGLAADPDVVLEGCATVFGSTTVTCLDTTGLAEGVSVSGTNIPAGATIVSVADGTHFVISAAATGTTYGHTVVAGGANFYVADTFNHCIRKVTAKGEVTVLAGSSVAGFEDGAPATARFLFPTAVALDSAFPPNVYVADTGNHRIRMITPDGTVTTVAGTGTEGFADGAVGAAQFSSPSGIAVAASGELLVADTGNHLIRSILAGTVSTFAGSTAGFADGPAGEAKFNAPTGIAYGADEVIYVADSANHRIRVIQAGQVSTYSGSGIAGTVNSPVAGLIPPGATQFNSPIGIAVAGSGEVYVSQQAVIRKVAVKHLPAVVLPTPFTGTSTLPVSADISGILPGTTYYFRAKGTCLQADVAGEILSFTTPAVPIVLALGPTAAGDQILNGQISPVDFGTTLRGVPVPLQFTISNPNGKPITVTSIIVPSGFQLTSGSGLNVIPAASTFTFEITLTAATGGSKVGSVAISSDAPGLSTFGFPITGVVVDRPLVVTQAATANIAGAAILNGTVNPQGDGTTAWFQWSLTGQYDGVLVSTLAGGTPGYAEGVGAAASFDEPQSLTADAAGNIYVADRKNHRIRRIGIDGSVSTFAGTGVAGFADGPGATAQFNEPTGIVISSNGTFFVCDSLNHRIRAITPGGEVRTHSGSPLGEPSFTDGVGTAARFSTPWALAIDSNDVLYVADRYNHRIRKVATDGSVSTLSGNGTAGSTDGAANVAQFDQPIGVGVDAVGVVYVTEVGSHAIRRVTSGGTTTTFAGSRGTSGYVDAAAGSARFTDPTGLSIDQRGTIYVADRGNHRIRKITFDVGGGGVVTTNVRTYAGTGVVGGLDGLKDVAQFAHPISVFADTTGAVTVGELTAARIRSTTPTEPLLPAATNLNGTSVIPVALEVTGLEIGTVYHYRLVAANVAGTSYGTSFSLLAGSPFELWQLAKFGPDADPSVAGPSATPANDGVTNLVKYALGLEPLVKATASLPMLEVTEQTISLTYNKAVAASDVVCTAQWTSDFITWNTVGITEQVFPSNGITQQITASIPIAPHRVKFLRLNVTFQ